MHGKADGDGRHKSGRMELSVAQVAGSALAAVAAAVLASKLGVYGTILGAGVVSVVATAGGTVFQHLFRRTGEQIKEARVQVRPAGRRRAGPAEPVTPPPPAAPGEYGAPTTHGTRLRGRRRHALGALTVFVAAMSVITGIEMVSGGPVSNVWGEDRSGTTVSESVTGSSGRRSTPAPSRRDPATPSRSPGSTRDGGDPAPTPRTSRGGGSGAPATPAPGPSGSSGSGAGSGAGGGPGGTTAPGTSAPATPGPSRTPSGGATDGGADAGGATPTAGATAGR
ncbi:hypothetical protein AB0B92_28290 [Streptomyces hygroscopicus]|uniref:hypothetical protein n=1 Tax=Streptomyces TaxID=1883 RepID=UPI0020A13815|nr:hypothetical protein [Streptomyces sp. RKCA744]MCO8303007.1 hypothetical protein [Streptomyces sp. RKCA744]